MPTKKSRRANGDGSIYVDKARNKIVAAITGPDGRRVTKRFPMADRQAARDWLVEQQADISRGDYVSRTDITLGEWLLEFVRTYKSGLKPVTLNNYYQYTKKIQPIADLQLQDLTSVILQKYFNSLPYAHKTQIEIRNLLSMALRKACALQMIRINPLADVEVKGGIPKQPIEVLTTDEITKILTYAKSYNNRIYVFILTEMYTGLRAGELTALRWSDIDTQGAVIHVTHNIVTVNGREIQQDTPKTSASRRGVSIPQLLVDALGSLRQSKVSQIDINDQYVFKGISGHKIGSNAIKYYWTRVQKKAGVPYRKFHALRHTHASQLLAAGVPITEVSRRLGHSSPAVTLKVYSHFIPGNDRAVADKVQEIFGS